MRLDSKSLEAIGNLAYRFWAHVFRRAVRKPGQGEELAAFRKNYLPDKLEPLTGSERALLLDSQRCVNCGTCTSVCPVVDSARDGFYRGPGSITAALTRSFPDFGAARDAVYNCTQCARCAIECPRGIDIPGLILAARHKTVQVADIGMMKSYNTIVEKLAVSGNIYGKPCDRFSSYIKPRADVVFFAGCVGRNETVSDTILTIGLLEALKVDFTMIEEYCCGGFHRSIGIDLKTNEGVRKNIDAIIATGAKKVVTGCPHGFEVMKSCEPYGTEFKENNITVEHITEFLRGLEFEAAAEDGLRAAYHDPCFLGRRNGVYDIPRELIKKAGVEIVELPDTREESLCCGSKIGTFVLDSGVSDAIAEKRMKQVRESGVGLLLTACPGCLSVFENTEHDGIEIESVAGFLAKRCSDKNKVEW